MRTHVLLINCKDEVGLIHTITGILLNHNANIIANGEFVDKNNNHFFMRTEFSGDMDSEKLTAELKQELPRGAGINFVSRNNKNIIVFATKEYHCLGDLLLRNYHKTFNAKILAVVSNHDSLRSLVEKFDIPYHHVPAYGLEREVHERLISEVLDQYTFDFLVFAKYMRICTDTFVRRYLNQIINIHHSFLPAFIGANPYKQAFDRGVKIIGATAHYVNQDLDEGPIIMQDVIPVDHTHSPDDISRAGKQIETTVLAKALNLVFEDRIFVSGNKTIIFD